MNKFMEGQKKIEVAVVSCYQKIEDTVVSGYKKIEDSVVSGYKKVEDAFGNSLLAPDGFPDRQSGNEQTSKNKGD